MDSVRIFDTLTAEKVDFVPEKPKQVRWYTCGPTVYDASHLGHARNYVAQDVVRRILEYFGYDVELVMNITDIDDKIITRSRELGVSPSDLTRRYEKDFFDDMDRLGVRRPSILTRVSEYIPEIRTYIQTILDHGFAYSSNGSVYFDLTAYTQKFKYGHFHPFDPASLGNPLVSEDGTDRPKNEDKRSQMDFALWKASKNGEPSWDSPWGPGRPGWHIECSAMATSILGSHFDLHSGGEDLRFPHHENEIAQATAHNCSNNWVQYFIHTGHLHIDGCKMSKSLKNFITIEEALRTNTPRQLRLFFLLHSYRSTLNISVAAMRTAVDVESSISEFLNRTRVVIEKSDVATWSEREIELKKSFDAIKSSVDVALRDDFDVPEMFELLTRLMKLTYIYMTSEVINSYLVRSIREYMTKMLTMLGLDFDSLKSQDTLLPKVLDVTTQFRDEVRRIAKAPQTEVKAIKKELFSLSDQYRDQDLPSIGIQLNDTADGRSVWKIL